MLHFLALLIVAPCMIGAGLYVVTRIGRVIGWFLRRITPITDCLFLAGIAAGCIAFSVVLPIQLLIAVVWP